MSGPTVVVIEDELAMRRFLRTALQAHQYQALEAGSLAEGKLLVSSHHPDVVLLDLGLPDGDGLDFTTQLREWSKVPVVVLSARGREEDKVKALDAGADDYLTKPFGVAELLARLRVALRHAQGPRAEPVLTFGEVVLDLEKRLVTKAGVELKLTPLEFRLFATLAQHAGKVLTHRQLLTFVWGPSAPNHPHTVRVHLAELRKKLEADPARPKLLVTEPGVGYRLREPG